MRSTHNNHCPIKGQMKQGGRGGGASSSGRSLFTSLSPSLPRCVFLLSPTNGIVIFLPASHPPAGAVALEGQPALSETTLITCDSLLSNQQKRGCQRKGEERQRSGKAEIMGKWRKEPLPHLLSQQLRMWEIKWGKLKNKDRKKESDRLKSMRTVEGRRRKWAVARRVNRELEVDVDVKMEDGSVACWVQKWVVDGGCFSWVDWKLPSNPIQLSSINCARDDLKDLAAFAQQWAYKLSWIPLLHRPLPRQVGSKVKWL